MFSYFTKTLFENQFDKVVKEFSGSDEVEHNEPNSISEEDLIAKQNRQAIIEKNRQIRQAKIVEEREEARQKIRDRYNIKKKNTPPTPTTNQPQGKIDNLITRINTMNVKLEKVNGLEPEGVQSMQIMTDAFNNLKGKIWPEMS